MKTLYRSAAILALIVAVAPLPTAAYAQPAGSWQLVGSDVQVYPATETHGYQLSAGSAVLQIAAPEVGDRFRASMHWTAPAGSYAAGEAITLTLTVAVDEYVWNGRNDGYIHNGLNFVGAAVSARLDQPGIGPGYVTGNRITLTAPDGQTDASCATDNGAVPRPGGSLTVSAVWPPGYRPDERFTLYVMTSAGNVAYTYAWQAAPTSTPTAAATATAVLTPTPARALTVHGRVTVNQPGYLLVPDVEWFLRTDGSGIVGVPDAVVLLLQGGRELARTASAADGRFQFERVAAADDLTLRVELATASATIGAVPYLRTVLDRDRTTISAETPVLALPAAAAAIAVTIDFSDGGRLTRRPAALDALQLSDAAMAYVCAQAGYRQATQVLQTALDLPLTVHVASTESSGPQTASWSGPLLGGDPAAEAAILLPAASGSFHLVNACHTVLHEFGHHLMADVYGNRFPQHPTAQNHGGLANSDSSDSWTEGFATFFALLTQRDTLGLVRPQRFGARSLEVNWLPTDHAAAEEDAISGLLWDLVDPVSSEDLSPGISLFGDEQQLARDRIALPLELLWPLLTCRDGCAPSTSPAAPRAYPFIFDLVDLHRQLVRGAGAPAAGSSAVSQLSPLDEAFVMHGLFADLAPTNGDYDAGENVAFSGHPATTIATTTLPAQPDRRSPQPPPNAAIRFSLVDADGALLPAATGRTAFTLVSDFDAPFDAFDDEVVMVVEAGADLLHYLPPPPRYPGTTRIRAHVFGLQSTNELVFRNADYYAALQAGAAPVIRYSFTMAAAGRPSGAALLQAALIGGGLLAYLALVAGVTIAVVLVDARRRRARSGG